MVIAGFISDFCDLDIDEIDQIFREVTVSAVLGGLAGSQVLLGLVLEEEPSESLQIHVHFLEAVAAAMTSVHSLSRSPVKLHPQPCLAISSVCQRLLEEIELENGMFRLLAMSRDAFSERYLEP